MKNTVVIAAIAALLIGGGGGFFAGMKYQQGQMTAQQGTGAGVNGGGGRGRQGGNGANRPVVGTIVSQDDKSVTVQLQDGSTKLVLIAGSTTLNKATEATKADITVGARVAAYGTQNADGSMTAQNIQLNPTMMFRGPQNDQSPSPSPKQ